MTDSEQAVLALADRWIDLAQPRLGAEVTEASDDFFAPKERLIKPEAPVFLPDEYDERGKWMDGWESRRKRGEGHDHCIVRLGCRGEIKAVDIDTSHFTGNYPPAASLDACLCDGEPDQNSQWVELIPASPLGGNSHHPLPVQDERTWSHLRLNIYPDGGVARLRVYGRVRTDWSGRDPQGPHDLAAMVNGGRVIAWSDSHYGPPHNITAPGRAANMGEGWETRRRREPGHDWVILALGRAGEVERVEVDTAHFKGNFPDRCSLQAAMVTGGSEESLVSQSLFWRALMPEQALAMDQLHAFAAELVTLGPVTHVRFNMIPDGGISRLHLFGRPA